MSFSGGRTSGYMCHWLLENKANEYEFIFVFANTGLEHEKTLEFVDQCDKALGLNLTWVEAVVNPEVRSGTT
ncbi:MAG: phosphoadenosine phosphosulfate reductase family protein, partial [Anaerolineales bacterium]|nr:phosphoadenosine phosphosulfate reductase family protein [Anaerolineales bacterium]